EQFVDVSARQRTRAHHPLERPEHRVGDVGVGVDRVEFAAQPGELADLLGARYLVDGVVRTAAERVDDRRAVGGPAPEQPRCQREALRVLRDALPAQLGSDPRGTGRRRGGAQRCNSSAISAAVAFAELTTPGTPAPGWVPAPTRYSPGIRGSRLWGRNH